MIYSVLYGHLNKQYVKKGDKIVYGAKIGEMGNTGQVSPMPTKEKTKCRNAYSFSSS